MATYKEVEQLRQKRHYVKYFDPTDKNVLEIDYTPQDVHPVYKDKFCLNLRKDLDSVCRQSKLIREILEEHDCNGENYQFKAIAFALKEMNIEEGYLSYLIKYIKIMTTINNGIDDSVFYNAANACATIDYANLYTDILFASDDMQELLEIFKSLSLEINAAALNGLFASVLDISKGYAKCQGKYIGTSLRIEKYVVDLYKRIMFGDHKNKPIEISQDPSEPWITIVRLNKLFKKSISISEQEPLTGKQIIEKIIQPFEQILLNDYSLIDCNEYDVI